MLESGYCAPPSPPDSSPVTFPVESCSVTALAFIVYAPARAEPFAPMGRLTFACRGEDEPFTTMEITGDGIEPADPFDSTLIAPGDAEEDPFTAMLMMAIGFREDDPFELTAIVGVFCTEFEPFTVTDCDPPAEEADPFSDIGRATLDWRGVETPLTVIGIMGVYATELDPFMVRKIVGDAVTEFEPFSVTGTDAPAWKAEEDPFTVTAIAGVLAGVSEPFAVIDIVGVFSAEADPFTVMLIIGGGIAVADPLAEMDCEPGTVEAEPFTVIGTVGVEPADADPFTVMAMIGVPAGVAVVNPFSVTGIDAFVGALDAVPFTVMFTLETAT